MKTSLSSSSLFLLFLLPFFPRLLCHLIRSLSRSSVILCFFLSWPCGVIYQQIWWLKPLAVSNLYHSSPLKDKAVRMLAPPPRPASPPLTDHALQFHQQVQEAGVTDGHVRLRVSQSNQLHHQLVHPDACSRDRWSRGGGKTQVQKH